MLWYAVTNARAQADYRFTYLSPTSQGSFSALCHFPLLYLVQKKLAMMSTDNTSHTTSPPTPHAPCKRCS